MIRRLRWMQAGVWTAALLASGAVGAAAVTAVDWLAHRHRTS